MSEAWLIVAAIILSPMVSRYVISFRPSWPIVHWGGRLTDHPGWWLCRENEDGARVWRKIGGRP
jgi:hypothetical protein